MAMMTVRDIPDEVDRALRVMAAKKGRSREAEVRLILEEAVKPQRQKLVGNKLSSFAQKLGLDNEDFSVFENAREKITLEPIEFK